MELARHVAGHRRWGVVAVRVPVRMDASIASRFPVPPPGSDLE